MKPYLKNRKLLAGIAVVGSLFMGALWPTSVPADIAMVEHGPLRVTIDEEGETRVRDRFVVSAPVAGRVLRIELEPGDPVRRGVTVLATFRPGDPSLLDARSRALAEAGVKAAEAALGRARAERQRAQAAVELAGSELTRHRTLAAAQIVSQETIEARDNEARSAEEGLRAAEFAVVSAQHELSMARARLLQATSGAAAAGQVITIRSPIDAWAVFAVADGRARLRTLELGRRNGREAQVLSGLEAGEHVVVHPSETLEEGGRVTRREG